MHCFWMDGVFRLGTWCYLLIKPCFCYDFAFFGEGASFQYVESLSICGGGALVMYTVSTHCCFDPSLPDT